MEMLTGKMAHKKNFENLEGSTANQAVYILEQLKIAEEDNYPVTFSSNEKGETPKSIVDADGNVATVFGGHAYSFEKLDGNIVCLYNPQGTGHLRLNTRVLLSEFSSASVLALEKKKDKNLKTEEPII